jgi:tetratricopeptide (TPR) repeat protein
MRCIVRKLLCAGLVFILGNANGATASTSCRECHAAEYELWASSHHGLAERAVSLQRDRAAFEPPRIFKAGSQTNEMQFTNGQCQIVTLGFRSNVEAFAVERVIGVEPVRQFLTATTGGRWQTQEVSYDPTANQWFDVYGGEDRRPGEWGHWTGRGMNWNSMCAECHNTRLQKNYDEATDSYHTAMDEMSVSCGACHAGLDEHVAWQKNHPDGKTKDRTLSHLPPVQMLDTCGSCHALREDITGNFKPGNSFFDHYQLQIPGDNEDWYADGQVRSEDYEFASFLGSKMHERGVTCLDCHNAHSMKPLLPGNDLCMRCHGGAFTNAPVINPAEHSHHSVANNGNLCIGCHMPVTTYMQRHNRHDHSFTIPDPQLTRELNIPNACNHCHADKSVEWAMNFTDQWYGQKMNRPTRDRARWLAAAQRGDKSVQARLTGMLFSGHESPYWRAVSASLLWQWSDEPEVKAALVRLLRDENPLVRGKAIESLEQRLNDAGGGGSEVAGAIEPMLQDQIRAVRVAAAWLLRANLDLKARAGKELQGMLDYNADQPVGQYRKAMFSLDRGDATNALIHLRLAETWDPFSPPIRLETAELLSQLGRTDEALPELQTLCRQNPNSADYQFKLGMALSAAGQIEASLATLNRAAALSPKDPQIPSARAAILIRAKRYQEARAAINQSLGIQPAYPPALQLLRTLPDESQ